MNTYRVLALLLLALPTVAQVPMPSDSTAFALDLHRRIAKGQNVMLSPYSIRQVMGMVLTGADGETRAELQKSLRAGLGFLEEEERLRKTLTAPGEAELRIANALFLKEGYPFLKEYVAKVRAAFGAEVFSRPFGKKTLDELNAWASRSTSGRIPKILDDLDEGDRAVLLNAVYFKGKWVKEFPKTSSRLGGGPYPVVFQPTDGKAFETKLMSQDGRFDYAETAAWQAVRLPYKGDRLALLAVLPAKASSMSALRAGLSATSWRGMRGELDRRAGLVALPRFKFDSGMTLNKPLAEMGMPRVFDRARADLSGMSRPASREDELYLSRVLHKTYVEVDEEGTVAAAVTAGVAAVRGSASSGPPPFRFVADRPFLFAIEDLDTGTILFLGEVHDPRR